MTASNLVRVLLGILVSALFVWLVLRGVPLADVGGVLAEIRPLWLMVAVGAFGLDYAARIHRWKLMLVHDNPVLSWGRCMVPFMASIAANNVLPFRAGDVLRAVGFSGWLGVPTANIVVTLLVERLMDLLALLVALGLALWVFRHEAHGAAALVGASGGALMGVAFGILLFLVFPHIFMPLIRVGLGLAGKVSPTLALKLEGLCGQVFGALAVLSRGPLLGALLGWSALIWVLEACVFYAVAMALPALTAPHAAWLAMPVATLSTLLPSTPGYVGTFHFFAARAAEMMGNPAAAAASFAIAAHLTLWLCATVWGGMCCVVWVWTRSAPSKKETSV